MLAYDLETTASDPWHGGLPFFVAMHDGVMNYWWEFDVDPFTRLPLFTQEDLNEIDEFLTTDEIVAHNAAFDLRFTERMYTHGPTISSTSTDNPRILCESGDRGADRRSNTAVKRHTTRGGTKNTGRKSSGPRGSSNSTRKSTPDSYSKTGSDNCRISDRSSEWSFDFRFIEDSLIAAHALRNLWGHKLKHLRDILLGVPTDEKDKLQEATNAARRIVKRKAFVEQHGEWRIAGPSDPHWPAIHTRPKSGWWVLDTWLPRAICRYAPEFLPEIEDGQNASRRSTERSKRSNSPGKPRNRTVGNKSSATCTSSTVDEEHSAVTRHPWYSVCRNYSLEDVETTWYIWFLIKEALIEEGLWEQYLERKAILEYTYQMAQKGISLHPRIHSEIERYRKEAKKSALAAVKQTKEKVEDPAKFLNSTKQLSKTLFTTFALKPAGYTKKAKEPSTDARTIQKLIDRESLNSPAKRFLENLIEFRRNTKAADYLQSYLGWSTACAIEGPTAGSNTKGKGDQGYRKQALWAGEAARARDSELGILSPNISITGTRFTRQSSREPNLQNVGTGKERVTVDPRSGEVKTEIDFKLRQCFGPREGRCFIGWDFSNIELRIWGYECGNQEFIHAFEQGISIHLVIARELHPFLCDMEDDDAESTKDYKRTKNGNFSVIYGASPAKANVTYGVKNAHERINIRFPEVKTFTADLFDLVSTQGYIETLTGYRLYIEKDAPHKAVSAFVQGSAGAIIGRAMVDVGKWLADNPQHDTHMILQIHDELLFDAPYPPPQEVLDEVPKLMAQQGDKIGIPLPVGGEIYRDNWAEGEPI